MSADELVFYLNCFTMFANIMTIIFLLLRKFWN